MGTPDSRPELVACSSARDTYLRAMRRVTPDALSYLKPGGDDSVGGIAVHVNFVLEYYLNVFRALIENFFVECRPEDPAGLQERASRRAKSSLRVDEFETELATTMRPHQEVILVADGLRANWNRKASRTAFGNVRHHPVQRRNRFRDCSTHSCGRQVR